MLNLQRIIKQRTFFLLAFACISGALMMTRLFHLQIIRGVWYESLVDANRFFTVILPPERGILLDRFGKQLVFNQPVYFKTKNPEQLYGEKVIIGREEALQLLSQAEAQVSMDTTRWYPLGAAGAHILGYTGPVTAEDIEAQPNLRPNDTIGKFGLERKYDDLLAGTSTKEVYEINALGKKMRLVTNYPGKPGTSLTTTLDPYLTTIAARALGDRTGAVVIQDAQTGGILALISNPSFDPNILSTREADPEKEKARRAQVVELFEHPKQLFFNRAIGGAYPPGSVFKLVTATAGLESGSLDANTVVRDEGVLKVGEYSYANWYYSQYGRTEGDISLQKAISRSNDIYFYKAAEFIGPEKLAEFAKLFGYGARTGIELPGESAGFVPSPSWKEERQGEKWYLGNTYHFGIGQGDLLVTPLQVTQMTQAIVSRGKICQPSLLSMDTKQCKGMSLTDEHLKTVLSGMLDACSAGGTAFPFFGWNTKYRKADLDAFQAFHAGAIACKTGTAEFGITTADDKKKTHGWFTVALNTKHFLNEQFLAADTATSSAEVASGSAQRSVISGTTDYTDHSAWLNKVKASGFPETLVMTVLVESGDDLLYKEGSKDAAPVAKKIVDWMAGIERPEPVVVIESE